MYHIYMIEDDKGILDAVAKRAKKWNLKVDGVTDFSDIVSEFVKLQPHLVIIDIGLPFFDGYHWCTEIRKISKVPIIFLSSASDQLNMIMAMNMGGDDFVAKPFDSDVLVAKINALLRRTYDFAESMSVLGFQDVFLNLETNMILYHDAKIELTKNENKIMALLIEGQGKIVSRERLMDALWESDCFIDDNTLTVNINRLRKKLEQSGLENFIQTKFGVGYFLREGNK